MDRSSTTFVRRPHKLALVTAIALGGLPIVAGPAHSLSYSVTSTADTGVGSLREAVALANANPGPDQITVPPGTYDVSAKMIITGDVQIVGTGGAAATIIDGDQSDRLFHNASGATLTLQGLTVKDFKSQSTEPGGAIQVNTGGLNVLDSVFTNNESRTGAAFYTAYATVSIQRSSFIGNKATSAINGNDGGAIHMSSTVFTIDQSLFEQNQAIVGQGGAMVVVQSSGTLTNTTITDNHAGYYGGAIRSDQSTTALRHSTIAENTADYGGGGLFSIGTGNVSLLNTLVFDNNTGATNRNCEVNAGGTFSSSGGNLSDDPTCTALSQPSDLSDDHGTALAPAANNGGPTRTRALIAGSSAIDASPCSPAVVVDQRNETRPSGTDCDAGAFELALQVPPSSSSTSTSSSTTTSSTSAPSSTTTSNATPAPAGSPVLTTASIAPPASAPTRVSAAANQVNSATSAVVATPRFTG